MSPRSPAIWTGCRLGWTGWTDWARLQDPGAGNYNTGFNKYDEILRRKFGHSEAVPIPLLPLGQKDQVGDALDDELAGDDADEDVDDELEDVYDKGCL